SRPARGFDLGAIVGAGRLAPRPPLASLGPRAERSAVAVLDRADVRGAVPDPAGHVDPRRVAAEGRGPHRGGGAPAPAPLPGAPPRSGPAGPTRSVSEHDVPWMTRLWAKSRAALQMCARFARSAMTLFATIGRFRRRTLPYFELIRIEPA